MTPSGIEPATFRLVAQCPSQLRHDPGVRVVKAQVCGRSTAGIAGSNSNESMDFRLLCLLCVVQVAAPATS